MKNKLLFAIIACFSFLSQSCKKETEPPVIEEAKPVGCNQYDFSSCMWGGGAPDYRPVGPKYLFPCFNPNNANEFIYVKSSSIYKYNLQTKQNTLIAANVHPIYQPDWSRTGWIVFSDMGWKVWKVRDNGTGLQQISFGINDQNPAFNPSGDKIIYNRRKEYSVSDLQLNPALANEYKMLLIDLVGNPLDSVCSNMQGYCFNWDISSWADPNKILRMVGISENEVQLGYYNYKTRQDEPGFITFKDEGNGQFVTDFQVLTATKILYVMSRKGLFEFDTNSRTHRQIRSYCHDLKYNVFSISPDKTRLLVEKEVNTQVETCLFDQKKTIVLMNLDGSGEQEIQLP